jgi:hypothetical protein
MANPAGAARHARQAVQTVEEGDQVIVTALVRRRVGHLEACVGQARLRGMLACGLDRRIVIVDADEL